MRPEEWEVLTSIFFSGRIESVCVFYKYLRSSVIPPRPILVKKLMANLHIIQLKPSQEGKPVRDLVSLGLSLGRSPSQHICNVASLVLATSLAKPMNSASSFNV